MTAQPRAIVVMGVAGSGKTSVALELSRHYGYAFLDADDFHTADAKACMAAGVPLTDEQRDPCVEALAVELQRLGREGRSTVLAFSGLRAVHRQRLRDLGLPMRFVFLHAEPSVIAARLAERRDHFMPALLLGSQFTALQLPVGEPDVLMMDAERPLPQLLTGIIGAMDAA